jgi:hypothetical protein
LLLSVHDLMVRTTATSTDSLTICMPNRRWRIQTRRCENGWTGRENCQTGLTTRYAPPFPSMVAYPIVGEEGLQSQIDAQMTERARLQKAVDVRRFLFFFCFVSRPLEDPVSGVKAEHTSPAFDRATCRWYRPCTTPPPRT